MAEPPRSPVPAAAALPPLKALGAAVTIRALDLTPIREAMGEEWARHSQQIHLTLQNELKRSLSGSGWFWPGDNFYLLVFWIGADASADEVCGRARSLLTQHLKGLGGALAALSIPINGGHLDKHGRFFVDRNESVEAKAPAASAQQEKTEAPQGAVFAFEPVWNVRQGVVSAFRCVGSSGDRRRSATETQATDAEQAAQDAAQDEQLLIHVAKEWAKLPEGAVCLLIAPVRYETLANANTRRRYLEIAGALPERLRKFLVFEITHMPPGVMPERLQDFSRYLKRFSRMTTALTSIGFDQFRIIAKAEIPIVSCVAEGGNEKRLFELMDKFAEGASAFNLQTSIYGVRSPSLTTGAIGSGFVYVGGEAIRSLSEAPVGFFKFEMADVYRGGDE